MVGAKTGSEPSTTALFSIKKDYFELGLSKSYSGESKAENVELEISRTDVGELGDPNYSLKLVVRYNSLCDIIF